MIKFLRKSSIFNKDKGVTETEDGVTPKPKSNLGQIYKNAKIKLSKSLASVSQVSSRVSFIQLKGRLFPRNSAHDNEGPHSESTHA